MSPPPRGRPPTDIFHPLTARALAAGCNDSWHGRAPRRQLRRPGGGQGGQSPPPARIFLQFWQCVLTFQVKCGAKANFKIIETLAPTWGFCALIQCVRSPSSQPQRTMEASQPGPGKSGRNVRSWGGFAACSRPAAMRRLAIVNARALHLQTRRRPRLTRGLSPSPQSPPDPEWAPCMHGSQAALSDAAPVRATPRACHVLS